MGISPINIPNLQFSPFPPCAVGWRRHPQKFGMNSTSSELPRFSAMAGKSSTTNSGMSKKTGFTKGMGKPPPKPNRDPHRRQPAIQARSTILVEGSVQPGTHMKNVRVAGSWTLTLVSKRVIHLNHVFGQSGTWTERRLRPTKPHSYWQNR